LKLRSTLVNALSATAFAACLWLLFRTLRLHVRLETPGTNPYANPSEEHFFYSVWHDSMIIPTFGGKHRCSAALTSEHKDGSFVAQVLRCVGMPTVRGSTNRIRPGAMRELIRATENMHVVVTPDGPRGPRREMSVGIVFLASHTQRAVVPTAYSCSRCWRIRGSWTDLVIPKPFARVFLLGGRPVEVPAGLDRKGLQQYATLIQAEMDRLNEQAQLLAVGGSQA
jgi:lysophospholipid acyltransferase (LPLAT)-like uncharacterized protein